MKTTLLILAYVVSVLACRYSHRYLTKKYPSYPSYPILWFIPFIQWAFNLLVIITILYEKQDTESPNWWKRFTNQDL